MFLSRDCVILGHVCTNRDNFFRALSMRMDGKKKMSTPDHLVAIKRSVHARESSERVQFVCFPLVEREQFGSKSKEKSENKLWSQKARSDSCVWTGDQVGPLIRVIKNKATSVLILRRDVTAEQQSFVLMTRDTVCVSLKKYIHFQKYL